MPTQRLLTPALALVPVLAAGCPPWYDAGAPIAVVPDDSLLPSDVTLLAAAAECWNLEFGTQLVVGDGAGIHQRVDARLSELACVSSGGGNFQPGAPGDVSVCPYYPDSKEDFFTVVLHELGHTVNILPHASAPNAVMGSGGAGRWYDVMPVFADEDRALFHQANPDLVGAGTCPFVAIDPVAFGFEEVAPCSCPE